MTTVLSLANMFALNTMVLPPDDAIARGAHAPIEY